MNALLDRRDFVRSLASAFAIAAFPRAVEPQALRLGILPHADARSFEDGVALGLEEASRAARLFGRGGIEIVRAPQEHLAREAAGDLIRGKAAVIIGALNDTDTRDVAEECDAAGIVFLNCGARADSLRRKSCSRFVFHVQASEAMYAAAAAKARESRIVLWTSSLEKYGASQLNDRFHARFGYPMDSPAWAGWFAVKIVWESMLRATGADRLRDTLASTKTQFDGHKGAPLSFRAWDHQLRQPLYATGSGADGRPREIPDITASVPVRDLLDTIGDVAGRNACRQP